MVRVLRAEGCVTPEEYLSSMSAAGFVDCRMLVRTPLPICHLGGLCKCVSESLLKLESESRV
eukprot:COSAG04_NODE_1317_length_7248_cov_10.699119_3_plen_62_part_00